MRDLPAQPSMSQTLMMNRIREEDAGLGRGYCPSLLGPFRLGRSWKTEQDRLRAALARVSAPKSSGWKVTTSCVAASRFGQQNVSSRGEAMGGRRGRKEDRTEKWATVSGGKRQERRTARVHDPSARNHGVGIVMCFRLIPPAAPKRGPTKGCCVLQDVVLWL